MAKKSSSKRKPRTGTARPAAPQEPEVEPIVEARPSQIAREARGRAETGRLEDEYGYITSDLRRVFILAGAMFVLLIVLNLALNL
jgi:hypothetical protein